MSQHPIDRPPAGAARDASREVDGLARHIESVVDALPPLTEAQRARLAALLGAPVPTAGPAKQPPARTLDGVPQLGDIFDGRGLVHDACRAVLDFGAPGGLTADRITREQAAGILRLTGYADRLDEREHAAALRRFAEHVEAPAVPPATIGAGALAAIVAGGLPAAVQVELITHLDELIIRYDGWLTARAGEWVAREIAAQGGVR